MNIDPARYAKMNHFHVQDATEQIQTIVQDGLKRASVIVDIGCGSGNVSQVLARQIPFKTFLACDINPTMIEYAKSVFSETCEDTKFFVCDISNRWTELNPLLTAVEGKVNLVWSTYVVHWIPHDLRPLALKNMVRLLLPRGRLYISVLLGKDIISNLPEHLMGRLEKAISIPTFEAQTEMWKTYLVSLGLHSFRVDYQIKSYEIDDDVRSQIRPMLNLYKAFLKKDVTDAEFESIIDAALPFVCQEFVVSQDNGRLPTITMQVLHIHGIK